ncbi:zinc finger protein 26-like [Anastrepha ludens]|uniref:zinc finger protein 26-like n=1 Tax=Anastrepha ludens TaxID=28586 RepID=UPI0023AE934D|nr:zinc finger protein 26-like [Anastrepha ludens]
MDGGDLQVVAFDDEQKFAVGRALMAIADEVFETPKLEPITYEQDDIIELLSDSENAADDDGFECEVFGKMCTDLEELSENLQKDSPNQLESFKMSEPNDAINFANRAVYDTDTTAIANTEYRQFVTQNITNEIIILDDDDDEDHTLSSENIAESNSIDDGKISDKDEKEKKVFDLLEVDTDDSNQPTSSNNSNRHTNAYSHNLEAFLIYLCPQCGVSCGNIKKWNAHTDIVHNFRSISTLNLKTVISRQGQLSYQCNTCEKKYVSDSPFRVLLNHRIRHMAIPEFLRCRLCEERFPSRCSFLRHLKKVHKKIALQKLRRTEPIRSHIRFFCPICRAKASSMNVWMRHLENEHDWYNQLAEKVIKIRDNIVECKTCAATFRSKRNQWHLLRHEKYKPFKCKLCKDASGYDLSHLTKHIRVEHLNEIPYDRQYPCNYCDKVFGTHTRRITHMLEMHTIQELACEVCGKKFNSTSGLLTHMAKLNHQKIK